MKRLLPLDFLGHSESDMGVELMRKHVGRNHDVGAFAIGVKSQWWDRTVQKWSGSSSSLGCFCHWQMLSGEAWRDLSLLVPHTPVLMATLCGYTCPKTPTWWCTRTAMWLWDSTTCGRKCSTQSTTSTYNGQSLAQRSTFMRGCVICHPLFWELCCTVSLSSWDVMLLKTLKWKGLYFLADIDRTSQAFQVPSNTV